MLLSTALVLAVFCAGVLLLSRTVILGGYLDLELQNMQQHLNRIQKSVVSYFDVLDTTAFDWASWDDTYTFVEDKSPDFVKKNLVDETFNENGLRLNFMVFVDTHQRVVFQKGYNWVLKKTEPVPQGIWGHLTETGLISPETKMGLLVLPEGLFAVVSRPILTSKETGPPRGQLIMGRRFDKNEIARLGASLELDLALYSIGRSSIPGLLKDAYAHVLSDSSHWINPLDETTIAGVVALKDIYGNPVALVQVIQTRDIYQQGIVSVRSAFGAIVVTGVFLAVVFFFMLERFFLKPIKRMCTDLQEIEGLRDLSLRVNVQDGDELGELGQAMNEMLEKLDRNEREMVRLERLSALGEMVAGINHNLNNILVGVTVSSEFLLDRVEDPQAVTYVRTIHQAGKQAADLVARLQDAVLGDSEEGVLQSLNTIVRDSIETARTRWKDEADLKGIEIRVLLDLAPDLPQIRGSSSGLYNIMLNLIFNAVDAMPNGGELEIKTHQMGSGVQISVRDTGIGMDEETQKRVFEPFFTTKVEIGTGLGLATVYNTVIRWGGQVGVDSVVGAGSVFTLWFPADREMITPVVDYTEIISPKGNILVVDDQEVVTQLVEHVLSPMHEVTCLGDSARVLPALAIKDYDVLILDLGMPNIPGDKLAQSVRLAYPKTVLVLMTGWRLEDDDPRLLLFDFVLKKPLRDMQVVRDVVARAVNLSQEQRKEPNHK